MKTKLLLISLIISMLYGCNDEKQTPKDSIVSGKFVQHESINGFDFINKLDHKKIKPLFDYINVHNGGGVSIGDINNDGLLDIYMTANMTSSKMFLNKGNMKFEDITEESGLSTSNWCTGTTMADVNNDGLLDIYVTRGYYEEPSKRSNLLFINKGNNKFEESAGRMTVDDTNYSIGSSFFDYDKDGDLDLIVANHGITRAGRQGPHFENWRNPKIELSSRLYRNDGDRFTDVTIPSGILSYGFCLSVTTPDIDCDGLPDIYLTVDHAEPDLLFKNNGNGTFTNVTKDATNTIALSAMGIDAGDINHDSYPDIIVAEMLSENHYREKVNMGMQNVDFFTYLIDTLGYHYHQSRNVLYQNNGNMKLSDVGQLCGVHKSDWSWSTLFMDYNNDTWQDIYVTNGTFRELYNQDNLALVMNTSQNLARQRPGEKQLITQLYKEYEYRMPQQKIPNYLFENRGNLNFTKIAADVNLNVATVTTGGAYGDLDNDGDLDLVLNNVDHPSMIFENQCSSNNYIRIQLDSKSPINPLNSKVRIRYGTEEQFQELLTTRGFQSSSEPMIHFGLGDIDRLDEVEVKWPDGNTQILQSVEVNQVLKLNYADAMNQSSQRPEKNLANVESGSVYGVDIVHKENDFVDYKKQVLLPHKLSEYGPYFSVGDVNQDKLDDFYIGGSTGIPGRLYIQGNSGKFKFSEQIAFEADKIFEDGHSLFADIDGDGDSDLVVTSTGYEFEAEDKNYQSRIYLNDGKGFFQSDKSRLQGITSSSSCVKANDIDGDGDVDLFIGGRLHPSKYPYPGQSALMINDGKGNFSNATKKLCSDLENIGMVNDAIWTDVNGDNRDDLIIVGEWMPISIFIHQGNKFSNETSSYIKEDTRGWWNTIAEEDLDNNGKKDLVLGNLGLNYKYKASKEKPFMVYSKDFDNNGSCDIILGTYYDDVVYPVRGKSCSTEQIPSLGGKFGSFQEYAKADIFQVYGEELNSALKYEVTQFANVILYKENDNSYTLKELPRKAQIAPINGIVFKDVNNDKYIDMIVAGNLFQSEIETGRADAGTGHVIINQGNRDMKVLSVQESGLYLGGDVKSLNPVRVGNSEKIIVGINKGPVKMVSFLPN